MKDRILEFLKRENKSSAQFAEEIGVQASGISHILSGRNNPSLDFVLKMLGKYPFVSSDWLLFGKGEMYRENSNATLFDFTGLNKNSDTEKLTHEPEKRLSDPVLKADYNSITEPADTHSYPRTVRIVTFYENDTFREFLPVEK